jgi:Holliday junction DNA helicase RuvA
MIDYITGKLVELTPTYAVVETCGVGYSIHIALPTYSIIQGSENIKLYVYELIREDSHQLYGFLNVIDRQLFLMLISVSGIGANTARMIMSSYSASEIQDMIASSNELALNAIKGIGIKTAQRIIVELKDKIIKLGLKDTQQSSPTVQSSSRDEAISALVMLGFPQLISAKTVEKILKDEPALQVEHLIRQALKML